MQYNHDIKMHRPKGRMCLECEHAMVNCSRLKFHKMPAIGKDADGIVIVRCSEFVKAPKVVTHPRSSESGTSAGVPCSAADNGDTK